MKKNFRTSAKTTLLTGADIYQDAHGNLIYYNKKKNIAYRIPAAKENTFVTYRSRFVLGAILFIFLYILFNVNMYISLGVAALAVVFMQWKYQAFLKQMPQSSGFMRKGKIRPVDDTVELTRGALILRVVLYLALAILLVVNTFVSENVAGNRTLTVISDAVAVASFYMSVKYFLLVLRKK